MFQIPVVHGWWPQDERRHSPKLLGLDSACNPRGHVWWGQVGLLGWCRLETWEKIQDLVVGQLLSGYSDLVRNVHHRFMYFNTWSPVGGAV